MIYLPHPSFNTDKADGGWIIGAVNIKHPVYSKHVKFENFHILHPRRIKAKFEKSSFQYAPGFSRFASDFIFGFLREDGDEFAIRFINNQNIDILGYWTTRESEEEKKKFYGPDRKAIGSLMPQSYFEFLDWLEQSLI